MKILDFSYNPVGFCNGYIGLVRTSKLEKGDKEITFTLHDDLNLILDTVTTSNKIVAGDLIVNSNRINDILKEEFFVEYDNDRYCVKEKASNGEITQYTCQLDIEDLRGTVINEIIAVNDTITEAFTKIDYSASNWTFICDSAFTKRRSLNMQRFNLWELVTEIIKTYTCEIKIDSINRVVYFFERVGNDNDVYFVEGLNLEGLNITTDTYELFTRCIPLGAGNLDISSINEGKNYIENNQYSNKIKTYYWKDERYTNIEQLKEDAGIRLEALSKPRTSLEVTLRNLANITNNYSFLKVGVGDTVTLMINGSRVKHRVFELVEYRDDPLSDNITLDNTTPNLESYLQESQNDLESLVVSYEKISVQQGEISLKVQEVEYDVNEQAKRIESAESKITPDAIIDTVTKSDIYINDLGEKVTIDRFTEFKQEYDNFTFSVVDGGVGNLVMDGHKEKDFVVNQAVQTRTFLVDDDIKSEIKGRVITMSFDVKGTITNSTHASMYGIELSIQYDDGSTDWLNCSSSNNTQSSILSETEYTRFVNNKNTVKDKVITSLSFYAFGRYFDGNITIRNVCVQVGGTTGAYMLHKSSLIDGITTIDKNGVTVDSSNSDTITNINAAGFKVSEKSTGKELLKVENGDLTAEGTIRTGTEGQRIEVSDGDYKVLDGASRKGFFGFRSVDYDNYLIPRLAMGHTATSGTNDYFAINPYKGNGENPQNYTDAYVDIAYKSAKFNDWSNIKMYSDGVMRIAPLKSLEITTNFDDGIYTGSEEKMVAVFGSSSSEYYNRYLDVPTIRNTMNGTGLVLAHRSTNGVNSCFVRVNCDSDGQRFFRPLTSDANVELGSLSFPWKKLTTVAAMSSQNVVCNEATPLTYNLNASNVLDNINFLPPATTFELSENTNNNPIMDVTNIIDTDYVELSDEGQAFINESELLKLALIEIKQLKERVRILENKGVV